MAWKDSYENGEDSADEKYEIEDEYAFKNKGKKGKASSIMGMLPTIVIGVGLLALAAYVLLFMKKPDSLESRIKSLEVKTSRVTKKISPSADKKDITRLEGEISKLEKRMAGLEKIEGKIQKIEEQGNTLSTQFDTLNQSLLELKDALARKEEKPEKATIEKASTGTTTPAEIPDEPLKTAVDEPLKASGDKKDTNVEPLKIKKADQPGDASVQKNDALDDKSDRKIVKLKHKRAVPKYVKKRIEMPGTSAARNSAVYQDVYQVKSGDTLYSISRRFMPIYGLSVNELRALNKLAPGMAIYPGQKIYLNSSSN